MKFPILLPNIFNHPFTYESELNLKVGDYVVVPFGKSKITGVVWDEFEKKNNKNFELKTVLKKLKVTKQSLNRVLKDLIKLDIVIFKKNDQDTRVKHVFLNEKGKKIFEEIFNLQKKRIYKAFLNSKSEEVLFFDNVLKKIINE